MRLLYVEDNRINALLFEQALRQRGGFELHIAEDGARALELAREHPPQVLVLDSHLPDTDGLTLLGALRELPGLADVPAFMCSADSLAEDVQQALERGVTGYWTKPVDFALVFADLYRLQADLGS